MESRAPYSQARVCTSTSAERWNEPSTPTTRERVVWLSPPPPFPLRAASLASAVSTAARTSTAGTRDANPALLSEDDSAATDEAEAASTRSSVRATPAAVATLFETSSSSSPSRTLGGGLAMRRSEYSPTIQTATRRRAGAGSRRAAPAAAVE